MGRSQSSARGQAKVEAVIISKTGRFKNKV